MKSAARGDGEAAAAAAEGGAGDDMPRSAAAAAGTNGAPGVAKAGGCAGVGGGGRALTSPGVCVLTMRVRRPGTIKRGSARANADTRYVNVAALLVGAADELTAVRLCSALQRNSGAMRRCCTRPAVGSQRAGAGARGNGEGIWKGRPLQWETTSTIAARLSTVEEEEEEGERLNASSS